MQPEQPQVNTPPMYGDSAVFNEGAAPPSNPHGGNQGEPAQAPAQQASQLDRNQMVTVKVDGIEQQVTLGEALDGYNREQHYTQEMQKLRGLEQQYKASAEFVAKLEADPAGTMKLIADHYQLGSPEPQEGYVMDQPDPEVTALRQQVAQMQQQMERSEAQRNLDQTLTSMYAEVGENFDRDAVIKYAVDNNIQDVRQAWKAMEYDRLKALEAGQQVQQQQRSTAQQVLLDQASGVLPGIAPGSPGAATAGGPVTGSVNTVTDAFLAAKQELNLS